MPLYDYECLGCGRIFELRQGFQDSSEVVCAQCSGRARRKFHPVPIIFKGSGFYVTDYKHNGHSTPSENGHEDKAKVANVEGAESSKKDVAEPAASPSGAPSASKPAVQSASKGTED